MEAIDAPLRFEPHLKALGDGKYGLRKMMRGYRSFLGDQADVFPGFEPKEGEYVIRVRTGGSSVFASTAFDSHLRNNRIFVAAAVRTAR